MGLFTSRPMPTRRSKRIAWQKYRRLTIDTDVTTDDDEDAEDAEDDAEDVDAEDAEDVDAEDTAPRKRKRVDAEDDTTMRTMTKMTLRISKCKCKRTPFDIVTGSAQVWCVCNRPDESTEAEWLDQYNDRDEYWRRFS